MRVRICRLVTGARCCSVIGARRPSARATTSAARSGVSKAPPSKGSSSTGSGPTSARTTKCPGSPTPWMCRPTRRPTSIISTESVIGMPSRRSGRRLSVGRRGEAQEQLAAELLVIALVGLDDVAIERGRLPVPRPLTELDELPVLDDGDGLARELTGGHALDGRLERVEIVEQRPVALAQWIGVGGGGNADSAQAVADHAEVLGLVSGLPGEGQLHVDVVGDDEPARRDLGGLDLVLEC